jgi:hypothetical protein
VERRLAVSLLRLVVRLLQNPKSTRLLPGLPAIRGLLVLALVYGLLFSKIQRQRLLTDLGLLRALRTLAAVYKTMYSRSSLYDY